MKFEISAQLKYQINAEASIFLNIHALNYPYQQVLEEKFSTSVQVEHQLFNSYPEKSRLMRLTMNGFVNDFEINYQATVENAFEIKTYEEVKELDIAKLPAEILHYLNPSRYCQSDKLYRLANNMFGNKSDDFEKVMSLTEWIYSNIEYLSGSTDSETSAYDTVTEQAGVCRDFAHLGIALCRALTIPARYFTGYAYQLKPQDFHACFEAYINGEWLLFDATGLCPLNGMVKLSSPRDATYAAMANLFGPIVFVSSEVSCNLINQNFKIFKHDFTNRQGISYL